jgi:hypothetical protein
MKRFNFVLALLPLLLVTSCVTRTVREKRTELCANLATLNSAIAVFRRVSNNSTVDALKQAEDRVSTAFRNVRASARDVEEVKIDDLEKAYDALDKAVDDLPDQSSNPQAIASISEKVAAMESALTRMESGLRCP